MLKPSSTGVQSSLIKSHELLNDPSAKPIFDPFLDSWPFFNAINQRALNTWRGRLQHFLQLLNSKINQKMIVI